MNYIEELNPGDAFTHNKDFYVVSADKTKKSKICYNLQTGFVRHFSESTIIDIVKLLTLDEENNIVPIKEDKAQNV